MRAEGISMPDPQVDSRGRVQFLAPPGGAKPDGPLFRRAEEKCRKAGGGGPKPVGPGK
jgi:hypothetical protein